LVDSRTTPPSIIKRICTSFLEDLLLDEEPAADLTYQRELLNDMYQRRHEVFQDSVNTLLESVDGQQRKSLEQLVLTAALVCVCS
jgi:hypothetical protein